MGIGIGIVGAVPAAYVGDILAGKNTSWGMGIFRTIYDLD